MRIQKIMNNSKFMNWDIEWEFPFTLLKILRYSWVYLSSLCPKKNTCSELHLNVVSWDTYTIKLVKYDNTFFTMRSILRDSFLFSSCMRLILSSIMNNVFGVTSSLMASYSCSNSNIDLILTSSIYELKLSSWNLIKMHFKPFSVETQFVLNPLK